MPTACALFPKELTTPPRRWVEARYNLTRWTEMPRGGHFAALEQPDLQSGQGSSRLRRRERRVSMREAGVIALRSVLVGLGKHANNKLGRGQRHRCIKIPPHGQTQILIQGYLGRSQVSDEEAAMRPTGTKRLLSRCAVLLAVAVAATAVSSAQGQRGAQGRGAVAAPPQRISVQVVQVKPEMVGTYQDLIKNELIPALKKAGVTYRWTFANGATGQGFTFVGIQPVTSFAQYDQGNPMQRAIGADGVANYNAKLRPTIVSTHTYIDTLRQDLSIQSNSPTAPPLAQVQTFQVAPGKGNDFTSIMTADYLPNYKKAGVKDFWVYAVNFGAPGGQIVTVRGLSKYAELDAPGLLQQAGLSPEAAAPINARRAAIASVIGNDIVRFVPELSFGSPNARPVSH